MPTTLHNHTHTHTYIQYIHLNVSLYVEPLAPTPPQATSPKRPVINTELKTDPNTALHIALTPTTVVLQNEWIRNFEVECVKVAQPIASLRTKIDDKQYEKAGAVSEILERTLKDFTEKYEIYKKSRLGGGGAFFTHHDAADALIREAEQVLESYNEKVVSGVVIFFLKNVILNVLFCMPVWLL